jgi:hypothetical protein
VDWLRNVEVILLLAGIVAFVASLIYTAVWLSVILGLVVLRTVQRVIVLTRRAKKARATGSGGSSTH